MCVSTAKQHLDWQTEQNVHRVAVVDKILFMFMSQWVYCLLFELFGPISAVYTNPRIEPVFHTV